MVRLNCPERMIGLHQVPQVYSHAHRSGCQCGLGEHKGWTPSPRPNRFQAVMLNAFVQRLLIECNPCRVALALEQ